MADENKKGITVKIDADLHAQVKAYGLLYKLCLIKRIRQI